MNERKPTPTAFGGVVGTTTRTEQARRFANPDDASRKATLYRFSWPLVEMTRHPHGTDRARGFAVELAPGRWLANEATAD